MSRWLIGGALVAVVAVVLLVRPTEPAAAAPPEEHSFDSKAALRVTRKGPPDVTYLVYPKGVRIGDRPFLYGNVVGGAGAVYIPVSDIDLIEQYSNVDEMRKAHRLPGGS
jgi:hypothetical protein